MRRFTRIAFDEHATLGSSDPVEQLVAAPSPSRSTVSAGAERRLPSAHQESFQPAYFGPTRTMNDWLVTSVSPTRPASPGCSSLGTRHVCPVC